ncbi:uncharacterized mitochondrial protein AtMg00810-like [Brassica napus]|uniref:uncharacterized mitochondrial protein AtMg00810-like n=1 Tax=Brassica napus TaxID=3708 RepID=UPI0006AB6424|nr:uncharacterized mitochondrial protein AtMg00810-like [Brassica napus]
MAAKFEMSDIGLLTYYLGIEVLQGNGWIVLKQDRYAQRILEEAKMSTCNLTHVPMKLNTGFSKSPDEENIDEREYRRAIGCLRYVLHTRQDLSFSVGVLSRYMQDPRTPHGAVLKQVLRYLPSTCPLELYYPRDKGTKLLGYSDSSHNVDIDDGKSTIGQIFYLGDSPITWCSTKQEIVALSSCEAEFMAATEVGKQAIWLQELLSEAVGKESRKVVIKVDNKTGTDDKLPSYYIFADFVFLPLTQAYMDLADVSESLSGKIPRKIGEQIVILSQVLKDDVNAGYRDLEDLQLKEVNGVKVDNIKHLRQLTEKCCVSAR